MCASVSVMIWAGWKPPIPPPWIYVCIFAGAALLTIYAHIMRGRILIGMAHPLFVVRLASCTLPLIPIVLIWIGSNYLMGDGPWGDHERMAACIGLLILGTAFIWSGVLRVVGKDVECQKCKMINPDPDGAQFCCNCASDLAETGFYVDTKLKPIWPAVVFGTGLIVFGCWRYL